MNKKVYGVDTTKPVTPIMVRDAIILCFRKAHDCILEQLYKHIDDRPKIEESKKTEVRLLLEFFFDKVGGDFDNPTKGDLIKIVNELKKYGLKFRKPKVVNKHVDEINLLISRI